MPVRAVRPEDAVWIQKIYEYYVADTSITFEIAVPSVEDMRERIKNISAIYPWLVYEIDGEVKGYAYASRHRERAAYRWSVDFAVYVKNGYHGKGIGKALFSQLIETVANLGYYNAFGIITLPNERSIALHESFGFTLAGVTEKNGYKSGAWHDVGIWQLKLRNHASDPSEPDLFSNVL